MLGDVNRMHAARPVLVDGPVLVDHLELSDTAASRLEVIDPALASALRGSTAEVRVRMVLDVAQAG